MRGRISTRLARILENKESRKELFEFLTENSSDGTVTVDHKEYKVSKVITVPISEEKDEQGKTSKDKN